VVVNAPRALGQAGRWAVVVDAMLAVLLAAVAWPFSGLRPSGAAGLASLILILAAVAIRRAWPWAAWSLALAGGLIQVAEGLTGFVALLGLVLVLTKSSRAAWCPCSTRVWPGPARRPRRARPSPP
jgi:hypothetical protein